MRVFFDNKIQKNYSNEKYIEFVFHPVHPLIAVSSSSQSGGQVLAIYQEDGQCLSDSIQRKTKSVSYMVWHPFKKLLVAGWETSEISVRNETERETYQYTYQTAFPNMPDSNQQQSIKFISFSSKGSYLYIVDAIGSLVVWKFDIKGRLNVCLSNHSINQPPTSFIVLPPLPLDPLQDVHHLAKLAVSGDESALDMFGWKRNQKTMLRIDPAEAIFYLVGTKEGSLHYMNEELQVSEVFKDSSSEVKKLILNEIGSHVCLLSSSMMLSLFLLNAQNHSLTPLQSVKISGQASTTDIIWAGQNSLATCAGEKYIKMWDIDKDENYLLRLEDDEEDLITCISFSSNGVLACGTHSGKVVQWRQKQEDGIEWQFLNQSVVAGNIIELSFGGKDDLLCVNALDHMYVLQEQECLSCCSMEVAVVQTSPMQLSIDNYAKGINFQLNTDIKIKTMSSTSQNVAVSDGGKVVVYETSEGSVGSRVVGSFSATSPFLCMAQQNVYLLEPGKVQVRSLQGVVKQLLSFPKSDDEVVCMDASENFLSIATNNSCIKIFDLSRREAKLWVGPKNLTGVIDSLGTIQSVKCNSNGSRVSLQVTTGNGKTDSRLWVWDTESNYLQYFDFLTGLDGDDAGSPTQCSLTEKSSCKDSKKQSAREVSGRYVVRHFWDVTEEKLLVCEAKRLSDDSSNSPVETLIVTLFCTKDHGILVEDCFPVDSSCSQLVSVHIPFYYFVLNKVRKSTKTKQPSDRMPQQNSNDLYWPSFSSDSYSCRRYHRNYVGMEGQDDVQAMMGFSYHLTLGNMDEAFRAIKMIKSKTVWRSLAAMCVKTKRLDVARVCLAHMGLASGARLLREAVAKHNELDAQVACLAVVLGLYDDAERLLKDCGRLDLLNNLYQNAGNWDKALEIAEHGDRINLRNTHYKYAKHLESIKMHTDAIKFFEKSATHAFEVPHMLYDDVPSLERYVNKSQDKCVWKWWAQYLEFKGRLEEAQKFYSKAEDRVSMTRIYYAIGQPEKAAELCDKTEDRAACYWMACQHEKEGNLQEAISYYNKAKAFGNAIRLCKGSSYDDRMLNMAIMGKSDDMLEAARYYEGKPGYEEKCIILYHKAGFTSKALELAFQTKQFAALHIISESFDAETDPHLLERCAMFFVSNSQFDRAVDLLASADKHEEAIRICKEQHVEMTEDLIEKLSPKEEQHAGRNHILDELGNVCLEQRRYHLAAKKYTQAGQRLKAMKALLKSGDTEKICFFANVSRQKEVYIMAGHYLQSLDWQSDPQIMKNIITFYNKGKSPIHLAGFYVACAQLEIDEYNNYEKALGALTDAYKCMMKHKTGDGDVKLDQKIEYLKHKMNTINRFVKAKSDRNEGSMQICKNLLGEEGCEEHVRTGHIMAFMTEFLTKIGNFKMAHACIEELWKRLEGGDVVAYIDRDIIRSVHKALGLEYDEGKYEKKLKEKDDEDDGNMILQEDIKDDND